MTTYVVEASFACVLALALSHLTGCAGADDATPTDEIVGEVGDAPACSGTSSKGGLIYGTIKYRPKSNAALQPASGAILSFETPHTNTVVEATTDDAGSFTVRANDTGIATGKSITYDDVTYAVGATIGLSCNSIGYRFVIEPGANGFLEAN